jgi:hypothetical protein
MLDREYIENHLTVHNYESFGRSIIALILEEVLEQVGDERKEEVEIQLKTTVKPSPRGCIWLTMYVNGKPVRIHQPTDEHGGTPIPPAK